MISFIVQGPVEDKTQHTVDSIRERYPSSEIIIASTNGVSDISNVDLVECAGEEEEVILNKQILSSQMVNRSKFKISCKLRNDIIFTNNNLMEFVDKELLGDSPTERLKTHRLFKRMVLNSNYFFCNPTVTGFFFHPSDWLFLGLTEDLKKLFNIPKQDPSTNYYYLENEMTLPFGDVIQGDRLKHRPEQYIFLLALQENGFDVDLDYEYQIPIDIDEAYKWMINNFYVADVGEQSGFFCSKYLGCHGPHSDLINNREYVAIQQAMIKEFK